MRDPLPGARPPTESPGPSSGPDSDPLWTVRRAAQYLGLHEKTVYDMVARGELPVIRVGRSLRFDPRDMTRWVSARKEGC
jgi:excisionase family DNA binding protein